MLTKRKLQIATNVTVFAIALSMFGSDAIAQEKSHDKWTKEMQAINPTIAASFEIDEELVKAVGIKKISGLHLDLYTDVRDDAIVDELPQVFDLAIKQWSEYFGIEASKTKNWRLRAFLIANPNDASKFEKARLMPNDLPKFLAGFQRRHNLWFYLQPGDYYTRHLLIHEGTHGFMLWYLGGYGAPWYSEGMAELFGVHQWKDNKLNLRHRLRDRAEAPYWGRVKRIKDERSTDKAMTLDDVMAIPPKAFIEVRYYAWSWACCDFFSNHEKSKDVFAELIKHTKLNSQQFNQKLRQQLDPHWKELARDWELFIGEIEYGFEVARVNLKPAAGNVDKNGVAKFTIQANQSWQETGIKVQKGDRFRVTGTGEFTVNRVTDPKRKPWNSQSGGITIKYYNGHPLGMLHAGIVNKRDKSAKDQIKGLLNPIPIGLTADMTASSDGVLCLRINESPANLDDNQGALEVTVEKLK